MPRTDLEVTTEVGAEVVEDIEDIGDVSQTSEAGADLTIGSMSMRNLPVPRIETVHNFHIHI